MAHATSNYLYVPPTSTQTMEAGTVAKWNLSEGEAFGAGDILCEVETDKATVDFEAQDEGVVAKILVEAGPNEIQCGEPIVITVEDPDDVAASRTMSSRRPPLLPLRLPLLLLHQHPLLPLHQLLHHPCSSLPPWPLPLAIGLSPLRLRTPLPRIRVLPPCPRSTLSALALADALSPTT